MDDKGIIALGAKCELARRSFFRYCQLKAPDFYREDRAYIVKLCNALQEFYEGDYDVFVCNMPPRTGKSRTAQLLVEWILGKDKTQKIMTGSYNETLSTTFAKSVRNSIQEQKADRYMPVYTDVFPGVRIKDGDGAMNLWSLQGGYNNYLATSPSGSATGFGCSLLIVDDLLKNAKEAYNDTVKNEQWRWFCFTGDTKVLTANGEICIKDLRVGDDVISYNHKLGVFEEKPIVKKNNKLATVYKLEFENGQSVKCTGNHRFFTTAGYKSIEQILQDMRCTVKEGQTVLFANLQEQSARRDNNADNLFKLWKNNSVGKKKQTNEILFYSVQKSIKSKKRQRALCWQMGRTSERIKGKISKMSKMWKKRPFAGSPYRPRFTQQQFGKSYCAMSIVPYRLSQITRIPSSKLQRVYDIEVAENHNFLANSMLVHNCDTMLSRLEQGGKIIVIMTRWASNDLAGRVLSHFVEAGKKVMHINFKAKNDDGSMLCPEILSEKEYEFKRRTMGTDIFMANYQQEPIDLKGCLYSSFKTYEDIPRDSSGKALFESVKSYTDTADEGSDYLCSIVYGVYQKEAYILDVLYTKKPMEITEPQTAAMFIEHKVNVADIESNNGGKGFARNVESLLKTKYGWNRTKIQWFHQSANKMARILSASTGVMNHIYFPVNWKDRWAEFYEHITTFQREGKNAHDDAEDALSGVWEKLEANKKMQINTAILQRGYW